MPYSDPERQREYMRKWMADRRAAWFAENGPCTDCGTWDDLQLDHVNAATKVTHRVWSWARPRREAELAKCVARCRPCHARKTVAHSEYAYGDRHGATHLTEDDIRAIRASGETERVLARRYGVSNSTAHRIRAGQAWKYLE